MGSLSYPLVVRQSATPRLELRHVVRKLMRASDDGRFDRRRIRALEHQRDLFAVRCHEQVAARLRNRINPAHLHRVDTQSPRAGACPRVRAVTFEAHRDIAVEWRLGDIRVTCSCFAIGQARPRDVMLNVAQRTARVPHHGCGARDRDVAVREVVPRVLDENIARFRMRDRNRLHA